MKISYNVVKTYLENIKSVEELAQDLIMHTAEVEEIIYQGENLKNVFIGEVIKCEKHPDSDKLNCTIVNINGKHLPIVCGAPNVVIGMKVPVAVVGAQLTSDFQIAKTKIRGEISEGMICSEDELGLVVERQEGIMELEIDAPLGMSMRDYLNKNDAILEIDNKAINHRPDLFSHIGIIREVAAINNETFNFNYEDRDFSMLSDLNIINTIPEAVSRYIGLKITSVENIPSPKYIKDVLYSADIESKGLLIDVSNYSLYLYGQPTHCFDANKIEGKITIRYAQQGEKFLALNDEEYELSGEDIVIADDMKVLALGGIIGGKSSAVSAITTDVIIEGATFNQAVVRKSGKRLGIRTDSLNVFEKDLLPEMAHRGVSLIASELEKNISTVTFEAYSDSYINKQEYKNVEFDLSFINNIIGKTYSKEESLNILEHLGVTLEGNILSIPFWRKDLTFKADIAEEIARIHGYNNIQSTVSSINKGAVIQDNSYKIKNDARNYFTNKGFFDIYNYSFVNAHLMNKAGGTTKGLVNMKNALSEELTHMKGSHIPNLLDSLEKNTKEFKNLKLFELEKIFQVNGSDITENYSLCGVMVDDSDIVYYETQNIISDFLHTVGIYNYNFDSSQHLPSYAHSGRTSNLIIRGTSVGIIGEIHPKISNNFGIKQRIGFFEINIDILLNALYGKVKAKDLSEFQENNFDLNFVVNKSMKAKDIKMTIEKTDTKLINKVNLFDIYENEEKLPGKRSLSFKIFIQSMEGTLDDKIKNELITKIVKNVGQNGGTLR